MHKVSNQEAPLKPEEMLCEYCNWLLTQRLDEPFFRCLEEGTQRYEWYMIFYPIRALLYGYQILGDKRYLDAVLPCLDAYVSEQLPNSGFTSDYRKCPTEKLSKIAFQDILRTGKVNLADNGSNLAGLIQASTYVDSKRKKNTLMQRVIGSIIGRQFGDYLMEPMATVFG